MAYETARAALAMQGTRCFMGWCIRLARCYHRKARPGGMHLIRDHKSDCVRRLIEIPYDTPNADMTLSEHRYGLPRTSPGDPLVMTSRRAQQDQMTDGCHNDM